MKPILPLHLLFLCLSLLIITVGCTLSTGDTTPVPELVVEFVFPANNLSIAAETDLQIQIVARSATTGITHVELLVDGVIVRTATPIEAAAVPVFVVDMNWLAEGDGFHVIEAIAYGDSGSVSTPARIRVNVIAAVTPTP